MHQTDAHADAELALGGIEALSEPKRAERWMRPVEIAAAALLVAGRVSDLREGAGLAASPRPGRPPARR